MLGLGSFYGHPLIDGTNDKNQWEIVQVIGTNYLCSVMRIVYYFTLVAMITYKIMLLTSKELFNWGQLFFFANSTYISDHKLM